jgi:outer membrane protein
MKRYLVIPLLFICTLAFSQQVRPTSWSLADCLQYALDNNITVKQSQINVQQREVDVNTAESRRLPGLSASASENFSFGRGLTADNTYSNSNTSSTSFSLGADIPIFQGFDIYYGIKLSKLNLEAETANLEKAKDDIRVSVAQAYIQILYDQEILKVSEQQVQHDSTLLDQINVRRQNGSVSAADVSAQKATLAQSRLSATQASNNLNLAILDLTQLLELSSPEGFSIVAPSVGTLDIHLLMKPEAIYEEAVGIKPSIKSAQLGLDNAKMSIDKAKGAYLPSLSLNGGIGTNYYTNSKSDASPFNDQIKNNFSQYVGLSLNVPIFSRFSTRNSVKTAQLNYDNQQLQLESAKKSLYKEIQQAYYNAVAAQTKYTSSAESASSAKEHYDLTELKYQNGKASITDYNTAKNSYLSAESDYLKAQYECLYQTKLLDFYRGAELKF